MNKVNIIFSTSNGPITMTGFKNMQAAKDFVQFVDTHMVVCGGIGFAYNTVQFIPADEPQTVTAAE